MKSDFMIAVTQLAAEKKLPKEAILKAVEAALVSAFKKEGFSTDEGISVRLMPQTGEVKVYAQKTVTGRVKDPHKEISLSEAKKMRTGIKSGETIEIEVTPSHAGRIAAQTARQLVLQRLREAERDAIFEEYGGKEGEIYSGTIQSIEAKQIVVDIGRCEAIIPLSEQVRTEKYYAGQRLKVILLEVARTPKGPQVIVSRTHKNLIKRLFELEVPEIYNGVVELKSIAREPGYRSKVAVAAKQQGVEPVGCCVGPRGIRIQNIIDELHGEKIDVIQWNPERRIFIANALSPAQVSSVEINENEKASVVIVPDKQLSLAIGREGQNARLAAKLTGCRIDIKSVSVAESEKAARQAALAEAAKIVAKKKIPAEAVETPVASVAAPGTKEAEKMPAVAEEKVEPVPTAVEELLAETTAPARHEKVTVPVQKVLPELEFLPVTELEEVQEPALKSELRFAEDLLIPRGAKQESKDKKGKKKADFDDKAFTHTEKAKKAKKAPKEYLDTELEDL